MTVELPLSRDSEGYLRLQAALQGKDVATIAAERPDRALRRPTLDEALAPLRAEFEASGMTDEDRLDLITEARDEYRARR